MNAITCKRAVDYISKKEEGKLSPAQRFALWRHLMVCSLCKRFQTQNHLIGQFFKRRAQGQATLGGEADKQAIINVLSHAAEQEK